MININPFFSFEGKSTRSEYWAVNLCSYGILLASGLISALIVMSGIFGAIIGLLLILATAFGLAWVVFAVTARRCRDIGISPWFTLSLLIPYIAVIPFIVFGCLKSEAKVEQSTN